MCVAFPGLVKEIEGQHAQVDFAGTLARVNLALVEAKVGDYVLVHAGMAIQVMQAEQAQELTDLYRELEEAARAD
ncbi:MAG: HypC/HybG/HupF family hydrogenase formation chaperone [Acidaminococcaceae bacterium]|jgi:hydrogenase expression/formation protein HypC|nr:HypC/HybG/HupF family hydrogenase formation chaperone [Acidaminococcaceae bacterium]